MLRFTLPRTARTGRSHKLSAALVATASCAAAVALASPSQAAAPADHAVAATVADHIKVTAVTEQAHTAKQAADRAGEHMALAAKTTKAPAKTIQPTFDSYHVAGTANKLTDPVANITAAANYAADKYGSIDKVNSAY
ncbi:hypothetical protein [Streptomyces chattanoogensis]|uniref:Lipoprotein n=1 Tax=Streptomyces chattanoogensis TaxID=66876 RepID=A0A0N0GX44_9ACTN|nr:hypothetical protein [Streptomyces chattanoogensis]KPC60721.1 hypothetical protein ADL29_28200 [Streptomyces chattanoogensis]